MFENGSFLRRRKRFKLDGMSGNIKAVSDSPSMQPGNISSLPQPVQPELIRPQNIDNHSYSLPRPATASPLNSSMLYNPLTSTFPFSAAATQMNYPLLGGSSSTASLSAAYSQLLMQYYAMMPSLLNTSLLTSLPTVAPSISPYNFDTKMMSDYASMLSKQSGLYGQVKHELNSDCESYGDRSSPLSSRVSPSPSSVTDNLNTQEQALDLSHH